MKKIILWLAKVFKVDLTVEKIVVKEVIKEVQVSLTKEVKGSVLVKGDLTVQGVLIIEGEVTCHKIKEA